MRKRTYSSALYGSIGLHLVLLGFILWSIHETKVVASLPVFSETRPTIDAVAVSQKDLDKVVQQRDSAAKKKHQQELARKRKIEQEKNQLVEKEKQKKEELVKLKIEKELVEKEAKEALLLAQKKEQEQKKAEQLKAKELAQEKVKKEQEQALKAKEEAEEKRLIADLERKRAEDLAKVREEEHQRKLADDKAQALKQQELNARNLMAMQNEISRHAGVIQAKIHRNWRQPLDVELYGKKCKISVRLSAAGHVLEARVVETSGNTEFDRSTELAVMKSSPLPLPSDPKLRNEFLSFSFTFNPEA